MPEHKDSLLDELVRPCGELRPKPAGRLRTETLRVPPFVDPAAPRRTQPFDMDEDPSSRSKQRAAKPFTAAAVARYQPTGKRQEIPDGGAQGLRLIIQANGAKSWAMRFRRPNGRPAKLTLGPVDLTGTEAPADPVLGAPLTLAGARRLAAEVQRQRAMGRDVIADYVELKQRRRTEARTRTENTFAVTVRHYIDEHARPRTRRWKETARVLGIDPTTLTLVAGGLADRWQDRPVTEIHADDLYAVVEEARRHGIPGLSRRNTGQSEARARAMFSGVSKLFAWLLAHRRVVTNPCSGLLRPSAPPARDRLLSDAEIRCFWAACDDLGPPFGPLLKLLLVTGARLNEIARLTYDELSEDGTILTLPGSRTKNGHPHSIGLPPLAREILKEVMNVSGGSGFIFSTNGRTPVSGFSKIKARLDRKMAALAGKAIPPWRLHDLRRTAATGMARAGADLHVIERALNHVSGSFGGIVAVYQRHKFESEVKQALEAWAALLGSIIRLDSGK